MTIAESLKRFRKDFNLKQKDVADTLGVKQPTYNVYESKSIPSAAIILKLADAYNVSADYLLGLTDKPRYEPPKYNETEVKEAFAIRDLFQSTMAKIATQTKASP